MKKDIIIHDIITLIEKGYQDKIYFFTKAKNHNYFPILKERGYFKPSSIDFSTASSHLPFHPWPQIFYLQEISKQIALGEISSNEFINSFYESIREIDKIPDNFHLLRALTEINFAIPLSYIAEDDITRVFNLVDQVSYPDRLIEFSLFEGFGKITSQIANDDHSIKILKKLFWWILDFYKKDKISYNEYILKYFDNYGYQDFLSNRLDLQNLYDKNSSSVLALISITADRLNSLLRIASDLDDSTEYWRPAIPPHHQNAYHDSAPSILVDLLFKFSVFELKKKQELCYLPEWKKSNLETYKRLFIALATDFTDLIPPEDTVRIILKQGLDEGSRYERYHFLKENFDKLSLESQKDILQAITVLEDQYSKNEEEKKTFTAWKQVRWAQALKESSSQEARQLYSDLYNLTGQKEDDHPDFSTYMSSGWVGPISPWSIEDFGKATATDISNFLINFKSQDKFRGPDEDGLSRTLEQYVQQEPEKCSLILMDLRKFNYQFVSAIVDGYSKAWEDKKPTPVREILNTIEDYSSFDQFRHDIANKESKARWVVSSIARFIGAGTKNDENSFNIDTAKQCFTILKKLGGFTPEDEDYSSNSDAFTRAINEPRGKIFEAFILLSLRRCRAAGKDTENLNFAWNDFKLIVEDVLKNTENDEISLRALIGAYYRQFLFMNNNWIFDNIDLILSTDGSQKRWLAFLEGFSYVTVFVEKMYSELNARKMLLAFLRYDDQSRKNQSRLDKLQKRVIELGIIAYLHCKDDSVIKSILSQKLPSEWSHLFHSISIIVKHDTSKEIKSKAKNLLDSMFAIYEKNINAFNSDHFSNVSCVLNIFTGPDDAIVLKVFEVSSKYAKGGWEFKNLVDFMEEHVLTYPKKIGLLYVKLLESTSFFPAWPEEKIRNICKTLNESRESLNLSTICRIYGERSINCEPIRDICSGIKPNHPCDTKRK
ncbi:MAG: hypothetical protein A2504_16965 [Bdellovibrionales bacterium RIFOXYD12_FULL_39_22]|nr:MAG: hypothetical protein A2385_05905 [Bdellovibrionales bacterium RIFOXYB1_FULL_39_21]OFZ41487.1 MAG: hypothetical protein A2485_04655 [Bdellovibrionales bacterium RIFOXYC12_FULL_39_17]OFZ50389.1 MAG: hypothetical protein A2404_02485 [Bdellovibrionales bacterium RIFOXYC1_FULL_39_130]OFZ77668.1 MAG: hypothetical protein A2560_16560 [Bdellovibrionales bacterium RIFOXYD1_FULL_39_84]OFZ92207.1 MAG: hypothetical protein A2504_16965 [Bdellovibrionales bacterium RIFOXYD12_FULL_39_22]HLE12695.1 hy